MTLEQLKAIIGRTAMWTPQVRAKGGTIKVRVYVMAVRQTCGRDEAKITPTDGNGSAWVAVKHFKLLPVQPTNLY